MANGSLRIRALRGPNLWTRHTAVEAMAKCEDGEVDLSQHPDFEGRLRNLFPGVGNLQPTNHKVKLSLAHALEAATLHLQIEAGCPVTFSRTTATTDHGLFQVAVEYTEEQVGIMAIKLAHELCLAALNNASFDVDAAIHQLRELDEDIRLGPSTGSIVNAAIARGIPFRRLTEGSLVNWVGAANNAASKRQKLTPPARLQSPSHKTKNSQRSCCTQQVCLCRWVAL